MATIYKRNKSPYWWIKYRTPQGIIQESTGLRWKMLSETKEAKVQCTEKSLDELKLGKVTAKETWLAWVPEYLAQRYHGRQRTYDAYRARFDRLLEYLNQNQIAAPKQVSHEMCLNYLGYRQESASRNTALHELKTLGLIMKEAVKRGYCTVNPCYGLGMAKDKPEEKPEITDDEIAKIRDALRNPKKYFKDHTLWLSDTDREWMQIAFEIAIHQGCRLRETAVLMRNIDFDKETIIFNAKGGKIFKTKLHPELKPYLQKLSSDGRLKTCEVPALPSKIWWRFFKKLKMKHLCFHCTRVTVITRLARAGVPISQAMRFVGHASETIHRVYQRLSVDDLDRCVNALTYTPQQQNRGAPAST